MNQPVSRRPIFPRLMLGAVTLAISALAATPALAEGFERGPDPTVAALDVTGPFEVASYAIPGADAKKHNYGGATVYYPKSTTQTFGVVAMMPGFLAFQAVYTTLVKKVASHGFVVINIDSIKPGDLPDVRAQEMAQALAHVVDLAKEGKVPYANVADVSRRAMMGNSMGGGALLSAAVADPTLKAAVALQPWHTTKSFAADTVPTLIVACEKDTIAPNPQHSDPFYASLSTDLPRGEIEVKGGSHVCATFLANKQQHATVVKGTIAWLKRFLDEDMRYDPLIKGGINVGDFSRYRVESF
jgi:alpha-beta hydrolase superfamily lysophospholipase